MAQVRGRDKNTWNNRSTCQTKHKQKHMEQYKHMSDKTETETHGRTVHRLHIMAGVLTVVLPLLVDSCLNVVP